MKNLKRVLSLALTGTMLAGMLTIGASAANKDFTDADEIQHTEAVNVMSTLGVLKGKDTGAFDPATTVTRAEMAKIITVMLNGGNDPTLGSASSAMFSDISGHWARPYIEYCASMGIIAGMGDGTFGPDLPVTGGAAAKMLLVAMGYDSKIFEFTGADWEINVNRRANEAKLYEEIKNIDTSVGLSRDNTAQMAYNALEAKIMTTTYDKVVSTGEISWNYQLSNKSFLNEYFGAYTFIGTFEGNYNTQATNVKGQIAVKGRLDSDPAVVTDDKGNTVTYYRGTARFPYDFDISNIGEEVKVIFKDGKSGTANMPDKNDTIYGVFNTGRTDVITGTKGDVGNQKSAKAQIVIDGTKYDTKKSVTVIENYVGVSTAKPISAEGKDDKDSTPKVDESENSPLTTKLMAKTGDTIKAVTDPEDGKIMTVYVTNYTMGAVTAKNNEKVTISGVGAVELEGNDIYEDIAKGDIVVVTTLYDELGEDYAHTIVEKAEKVSGDVKRYKNTTDSKDPNKVYHNNVNLDGTVYPIHNEGLMLDNIPNQTATTAFNDDHLGEAFDLYLINGYVGAAIQTSESASNYSLVTAVSTGKTNGVFDALQLQVMDAEGNKTIITVGDNSKDEVNLDKNEKPTEATTAEKYAIGDIVVWSGKADDATVTIKGKVAKKSTSYTEKTKSVGGAATTTNCVLFAEVKGANVLEENGNGKHELSGSKFGAYNIRDLRDVSTAKAGTVVTNADDKVVAVFMDLEVAPHGATSNTIYGIVTERAGRGHAADGSPYTVYTVVSNDETYTVNIDNEAGTFANGTLVSLEPTADEIYGKDDVTVYTNGWNNASKDTEATMWADAAWVKEYSEGDNTLVVYTVQPELTGNSYVGDKKAQKTYAIDDDCQIVYVNADSNKGGSEIGVNPFDPVTGLANVVVVTKADGKDTVVIAIFVETSNKKDILG